jgi:hypothetical protein
MVAVFEVEPLHKDTGRFFLRYVGVWPDAGHYIRSTHAHGEYQIRTMDEFVRDLTESLGLLQPSEVA